MVVKAKISAAAPKDWRSALEGSKEQARRDWDPAEALPVRRAPSGIEFICFTLRTAPSAGSEITSLDAHRQQEGNFWRDGDREKEGGFHIK